MATDFLLGCTYNFLQKDVEVPPLTRFEMVRETGVFDYINWLPKSDQLSACVAASEKTGIPMLTGNYIHQLGLNDEMLAETMRNAARAGVKMVNVMLGTYAADGHELTDDEIIDTYLRTAEIGDEVGVALSFELHVDCWSEKYKRVTPIVEAVKARGIPFHLTIDYSHVIFKIDNPEQQEISHVREDVETGRVVLDPYEDGNLCEEWLALDVVDFAQFRPVVPDNPRNVWGVNPDGSQPRGIMYPFVKPGPGEWHSPWEAYRLAPCKEAFRTILRYHLTQETSPLRFVITEMIATSDYGMNAKFSLIEQNAACGRWIRETWSQMKAMRAAGVPLTVEGETA
ncbi:MAG: xylose isomerase [Rhodospirillaceae bacterium]|jgi:hypothetical protein|nr:xylose isomerase [Rhodospirillaceae bacterium]MBT5459626.1 xylose isomerase [Rhodospirillaceae bacterium]